MLKWDHITGKKAPAGGIGPPGIASAGGIPGPNGLGAFEFCRQRKVNNDFDKKKWNNKSNKHLINSSPKPVKSYFFPNQLNLNDRFHDVLSRSQFDRLPKTFLSPWFKAENFQNSYLNWSRMLNEQKGNQVNIFHSSNSYLPSTPYIPAPFCLLPLLLLSIECTDKHKKCQQRLSRI